MICLRAIVSMPPLPPPDAAAALPDFRRHVAAALRRAYATMLALRSALCCRVVADITPLLSRCLPRYAAVDAADFMPAMLRRYDMLAFCCC